MSIAVDPRGVKFPAHEIHSAGVDWLSCATVGSARRDRFMSAGKLLVEAEEARGNDVKPVQVRKYWGWRAGQAAYAWDHEAVYVQLSGSAAAEHWQTFVALADRVSRLDIQVTVRFKRDVQGIARALYQTYGTASAGRGRPAEGILYRSTKGGETLYLGSARSDLRGRVYDKAREGRTADYQSCWRWELQDRSKLAVHRARALVECADVGSSILDHVHHYFTRRGVSVPFARAGVPVLGKVPVQRSGDDRKLEWLRSQVQPSVRALVGRGHLFRVLQALGFEEVEGAPQDWQGKPPSRLYPHEREDDN